MKIVVVVSEFPKLTETFAYRNAVEYERLGHEVRIFHLKRFRQGEIVHDFMRHLVNRAFTYGYASPAATGALLSEAVAAPRRLARLLRDIFRGYVAAPRQGIAVLAYLPKAIALGKWCHRERIDHIHAEFAGHPATAALIAARVANTRFSFSAHAHDIFISQAFLAKKAQEAAFVRCISRYNMDFLSNLPGLPADKLRLVHCGVGRDTLEAVGPTPPGGGPLRVLYVGSLVKRKGVRHLIDSLALLPKGFEWRARIIGGGKLADDLATQARRLGLDDRLHFDGPQPAEITAQAFREAHVLVVPSIVGDNGRMEGIPVVLMEALANGLPVVASALSGIPELVENGVTGMLVPPDDAESIAMALQKIKADWPAAAALGERGRRRVASDFVVESNAHDLVQLMEKAT